MKKIMTVLTLFTAMTTWAQTAQISDGDALVANLRKNELQMTDARAIKPNTRSEQVLRKLSLGIPPSREGIPGSEAEPDPSDLIQSGYPTSVLIRRTIEQAERKSLGAQIMFYEQQAARIIQNSGELANEEATRLVLNRSIDIVQNIIKWAGLNSEMVAQFAAQFYLQSYHVALAYLNNPPSYVDDVFPRAKVGIYFSRVIFSNHGALITDSAKAIMLVKLLGYLGQDLNSDLRRRNNEYRYALLDILNLQKDDEQYQNILNSLAAKQEPRSSDLAGLRSQVSRILMSLPK